MNVVCVRVCVVNADVLMECAANLVAMDEQSLRTLLIDNSSVCVCSLLLRVLASPSLNIAGGRGVDMARTLCCHVLKVPLTHNEHDDDQQDHTETLFYQMAGDRSASYALESIVECCDEELLTRLLQQSVCVGTCVAEYVKDDVANFVFQTVLKRLTYIFSREQQSGTHCQY